MFEAVLFDFDGVILDSNQIKEESFRFVLREYPLEALDKFSEYSLKNGSVPRKEKFIHFFDYILGVEKSDKYLKILLDEFSHHSLSALKNNKLLIQDTMTFIKRITCKKFIVSGTDQNDLDILVKDLGIESYFTKILGSPRFKTILINEILNDYRYKRHNVVLIGDSINDLDASKECGIPFIGYNNLNLVSLCDNYQYSLQDLIR